MGIDKPGVPAKYTGEEWLVLERDRNMIVLRRQGLTHHEIAAELGIARSTVSTRLKKLAQEMLSQAGAMEVAIIEADRLEEAEARFFNKRIAPPDQPDYVPANRDIETFLKMSESRRRLHGVDAPTKHEWRFDNEEGDAAAERRAKITQRFMDLADRIEQGGIGSGRAPEGVVVGDDVEGDQDIIDAEVIEDSDEDDDGDDLED